MCSSIITSSTLAHVRYRERAILESYRDPRDLDVQGSHPASEF